VSCSGKPIRLNAIVIPSSVAVLAKASLHSHELLGSVFPETGA
jgi:hypothetical protein